ncbi:MAG: BrnT family toxin [Burkholderiales bacterium]
MVDFDRIAGFEWDAGNARKNDKHGVSSSEAEQVFFDARLLVAPDSRHSQVEPRLHALGSTIEGRLLHVTFTVRAEGTRIRVISARDAHRKERHGYESET